MIAIQVPAKLRIPIACISPRSVAMYWAGMPEAAVYEDSDPSASEGDIGADPVVSDFDLVINSESESEGMQLAAQQSLGATVSAAIPAHDSGRSRGGGVRVPSGGSHAFISKGTEIP
jgi:hypothetical protein